MLLMGATHDWRSIDAKHWQLDTGVNSPEVFPGAACPTDMVDVNGDMKQDPPGGPASSIEELQKTTCTKWINRTYPERCAQFDETRWKKIASGLPSKSMHFCIDTYEYPNVAGQNPLIFVNWNEAGAMCATRGKRLCNEDEWTFACEGPEALPYPYGYTRDGTACNIDRQWRPFNEKNMYPRDSEKARNELDRLWQGVPSGTMPRCVSPFGVHDQTGNVDEWTTQVHVSRQPSILKGGYWSTVRTRCRPSTRSHGPGHFFYQQGFRCCADPKI